MLKAYVHMITTAQAAKERGATMPEYGLMVALIAVVCLTAVALIGTNLSGTFDKIAGKVN